jgi:hypothetical protein
MRLLSQEIRHRKVLIRISLKEAALSSGKLRDLFLSQAARSDIELEQFRIKRSERKANGRPKNPV